MERAMRTLIKEEGAMKKCVGCGGKLDQRIRVTCPDLCGKCWLKRMAQ